MHWASSEQAWVNADAKELCVQGGSDMTAQLSQWAKATEAMHLQMLSSPSTGASNGADRHLTVAFLPCLTNSCLLVGNFGEMCLLGGICFSTISSPFHFLVCYGKGLLITTQYFTLWESGSFCFCFCPHRMFLSAPCEGTGNYRAIHLNLHNFRQIL